MTGVVEVFFFKRRTAYERESRDWGADVCFSQLVCVCVCVCVCVLAGHTNTKDITHSAQDLAEILLSASLKV